VRFACRVTTGSSRTGKLPIWDGLLVRSLPSHALLLHPVRHGKIMIEHLTFLAARHLEARFIWVDAENAPFLTDKLNIWMLPTIVCLKDNKVCASRAPGQWPLRVGGPPTKGEARRPRASRPAYRRWVQAAAPPSEASFPAGTAPVTEGCPMGQRRCLPTGLRWGSGAW